MHLGFLVGEGNGNPLQCSCLENPRDGGAWWAAVYGVAQSDMTEANQQQQVSQWASLVTQMVKNSPALQATWAPSLGQDYLQYSCLENSMDRGAWQVTVCGFAKESDTTDTL